MKTLEQNWFYSGLADVEYKKYLLLAYLQHVQHHFNQTRLYPQLAELVMHYRNLSRFNEQRKFWEEQFPKELKEADLNAFKLSYEQVIRNDALMECIAEIVEFALPVVGKHLEEGREIYEFVEKEISIQPIGILPIYKNEGYILIPLEKAKDWRVFEYAVKLFDGEDEKYRAIHIRFRKDFPRNASNTPEQVKLQLVKEFPKLPNPATFSVDYTLSFPFEETLLEVTRRKFSAYLVQLSA
ncbi:MAG: hypothetical protein L6Q78_11300 [Bacteroidia bacterium]|nr:hypothetical protein [Bacteroidia bacterium]